MFKCAVVPEEKLEACKATLAVLTSCHIYSVQKSKLKVRMVKNSLVDVKILEVGLVDPGLHV